MPLPIHALVTDETIRGPLFLSEIKPRKTRNGADYLDLKLRDATGEVPAKMWQTSPDVVAHLTPPCTVQVVARVDAYQGRMQLVVEHLEAYEPTEDEYQNLIPTSAWSAELLWQEIEAHLRHEIEDEVLWELIEAVLSHPLVLERAKTIPAASYNHHAYRAGLAEHMLSMLRLTSNIAQHYHNYYAYPVHRGLLAAGVLLHDLGKIWELSGDVGAQYTDEGKLLGHIFMAARWIEDIATPLNTPRALVVELQHLVLSHHGKLEFGSPKLPQTIEAMILHHVDKLDADMNQWMAALSSPGWTQYQRNYQRAFLRPDHMRETWTPTGAESNAEYNTHSWTTDASNGPGRAVGAGSPLPPTRNAPAPPPPATGSADERANEPTDAQRATDKKPSSGTPAVSPSAADDSASDDVATETTATDDTATDEDVSISKNLGLFDGLDD